MARSRPPEMEKNFSFAKEGADGQQEQKLTNIRIGVSLSPVKYNWTLRQKYKHEKKDLYYTQSIFNQEQSNYLAFEPKVARTMRRIDVLNKEQ